MRTAAVTTLKARLSEHLGWVKEGEEVVVTERGKPIARLVPIPRETSDDAHLTRLVAQGRLRPGRPGLKDLVAAIRPVPLSERVVLDALRAEREEGG